MEIIAIVSAVIAFIALIVAGITASIMARQNRVGQDSLIRQFENRFTKLEEQNRNVLGDHDLLMSINTKIGVFWHMIEQAPLSGYMRTSAQDRADAVAYDQMKNRTPTDVLIRLGHYLIDEIPNRSPDERAFLMLKLGAIQAQLLDRGIRLDGINR